MRFVAIVTGLSLAMPGSALAIPTELSRLMRDYVRACMLAGSRQVMPALIQIINDVDGDGQTEFLLDGNSACDIPTGLCPADAANGCEITFWLSSATAPSWQGRALAAGIIGDSLVVLRKDADCPGGTAGVSCYLPVLQISPEGTVAHVAPVANPQTVVPQPAPEATVAEAVPPSQTSVLASPRPPRAPADRVGRATPSPADVHAALPGPLQSATDDMIAACNEVGSGGSGLHDDPPYVQTADLNGDGQPDYVQYLGGINCVGAASHWGGSAGFPASVWLSGADGYHEQSLGYSQDVPQIEDGGVRTYLHGQMCDPPRTGADGCEKLTAFR
jgi:hypothetical protein